uniref:Uncharacterized protein n=1 Tax=Salix viminalis TaxID=40686 RepID=A0A6N2MSE4_SALVM
MKTPGKKNPHSSSPSLGRYLNGIYVGLLITTFEEHNCINLVDEAPCGFGTLLGHSILASHGLKDSKLNRDLIYKIL